MLFSIRASADAVNERREVTLEPPRLPISTGVTMALATSTALRINTGVTMALAAEFQPGSVNIFTGVTVALRAADTPIRLPISTGVQVLVRGAYFKPIETGITVILGTATPPRALTIQTGLTVSLSPAGQPGFGRTRDLVIAAQPDFPVQTLTDAVLLGIEFTDPEFRSVPNDGFIQLSNAEDVQFSTLPGNIGMSHNIISHDPATGRLVFDLKIASWITNQNFPIRMLYGGIGQQNIRIGVSTGVQMQMQMEMPPAWWQMPIRSGRQSASGVGYWYDRPGDPLTAAQHMANEEGDVALIDAVSGSSKGDGFVNISNMNEVFGRTATGADDFTDTQFDWRPANFYGHGNGINYLPAGGGWIFWVMTFVPNDRSTAGGGLGEAGGDPSIWTEYAGTTHNALLQEFGDRFRRRVDSTGHPRQRFIIDAHHEMNQSNNHQVYRGTRDIYVAAMENIIAQVRIGAGYHVRFSHRPGYRIDPGDLYVGDYGTFCPPGVDVLCLSLHPAAEINTFAEINQMFAGTFNSNYYGTDQLIAFATATNRPIAFPEWSPKFELTAGGGACPVANEWVTRFFNNVIVPNRSIIVADCVYHQNIRDPNAYEPTDTAGEAQWAAMVDTRKNLWLGITG